MVQDFTATGAAARARHRSVNTTLRQDRARAQLASHSLHKGKLFHQLATNGSATASAL